MKAFIKFISAVVFALFLILIGILGYSGTDEQPQSASLSHIFLLSSYNESDFRVTGGSGEFCLVGATECFYFLSLQELIDSLGEEATLYFENIGEAEGFSVTKRLTLKGEITVASGNITLSGGGSLESFADIVLKNGSIIIEDGEFIQNEGTVLSYGGSAVALAHPDAYFSMKGGTVSCLYNDYAVRIDDGLAEISAGEINGSYKPAVYSGAGLTLGGTPKILGYGYSIEAEAPIALSVGGVLFSGSATVKWLKNVDKGESSVIFSDALAEPTIDAYSPFGDKLSLVDFGGGQWRWHNPFRVKFYLGRQLVEERQILKDEPLTPPTLPERVGYTFVGWYDDEELTLPHPFGEICDRDLNLFGKWELSSPFYTISSMSFTYDKNTRFLTFSSLSHPLGEGGSFSFEWYKDGQPTGISLPSVPITGVSDSGSYTCKITFLYGHDLCSITTAPAEVRVAPATVFPPMVESKEYSSYHQIADIERSPYYTVQNPGGVRVGEYPVLITLTDKENYKLFGSDSGELSLSFKITRAENSFLSEITVKDSYEGSAPAVIAEAKFGNIGIFYSLTPSGPFESTPPTTPGEYYLIAVTAESENYSSVISEPVAFRVLPEYAVSLRIDTMPNRLEYSAFQHFDGAGGAFSLVFNSGRVCSVPSDTLEIIYSDGDCLHFGDSSVRIACGGVSTVIQLSVKKAKYSLDGLIFSDKTVIYDGKSHTIIPSGKIIGCDGIPLEYRVTGGGINSGSYEVRLDFYTESQNYELPLPIVRKLFVERCPVEAVYEGLMFVYDKGEKLPKGRVTLLNGYTKELKITGAAINAGEYTARATLDEENYILINPTVSFTVLKADFDMSGVHWSGESFTYCGEYKSVYLLGLPEGLTVTGYVNAVEREAGEYLSSASVKYDEINYNTPPELTHFWEIKRASYDMSSVRFEKTYAIYDGALHYPTLIGEMPAGLDGLTLGFSFDRGVLSVREGEAVIKISFHTESENYLTPEPLYSFVEIMPKGITVTWQELEFTYDGGVHCPSACFEGVEILVSGGKIDSGCHKALAASQNPDYRVENSECEFLIKKAKNYWVSEPQIKDIFNGRAPSPRAESAYGTVAFGCYLDKELTKAAALPLECGVYYLSAFVPEGDNYLGLSYEPLVFRVIEVVPIELRVSLLTEGVTAMREISSSEILISVLYNDGSEAAVIHSAAEILYENGSLPKYGDTKILVRAAGLEATVEVEIKKATYDMSTVGWRGDYFVYDGEEKFAYLEGLPEGVTVVSYGLNSGITAGAYKLEATLKYDSENYNPPELPDGWMIIDKCPVSLPKIEKTLVYNGKMQAPALPTGKGYTAVITKGDSVGVYKISLCLSDPQNYRFEGDEDGVIYYEIVPRAISLQINSDMKSYTLLSGSIIEGDDLNISFVREDGFVYLLYDNPNYRVSVEPTKIKDSGVPLAFIWLLVIVIFLTPLVTLLSIRRKRLKAILAGAGVRVKECEDKSTASTIERAIMAVDEEHANSLLDDSLAKTLIKRSDERIKTSGKGWCYVNVDAISRSFSAGEAVDINRLKENGLVPGSALCVKVLGGGILDKPLKIKANAYSASAVKMIVLTGGEAISCKSEKCKRIK